MYMTYICATKAYGIALYVIVFKELTLLS